MAKQIRPWCIHYQTNNAPPAHGCDAAIVIIGEAPGRVEAEEDEFGRPFVGPSGYAWEQWIKPHGLRRSHFYIDNTYPFRPPGNDLSLIPEGERRQYGEACLFRLRKMNPVVIVPMGNWALRLLFPEGKMKITDWRGSILNWEGKKVIPTIHPAATFRQKVLEKLCRADWARIASELVRGRALDLPRRKHIVDPNEDEMETFYDDAVEYFGSNDLMDLDRNPDSPAGEPQAPPRVLAVDVENSRTTHELFCVGFSFEPSRSITVSTLRRDYRDDHSYHFAEQYIRHWLHGPWPICGLNFQTDLWKLVRRWPDMRAALISNYVWDLMELAHMLDPNDGGGTEEGSEDEIEDAAPRIGMLDLATLQSLHTREPFHKWMAHEAGWEKRQVYNGLDCCVTREIFDVLWRQARERNLV